jgi:hypothetical protein
MDYTMTSSNEMICTDSIEKSNDLKKRFKFFSKFISKPAVMEKIIEYENFEQIDSLPPRDTKKLLILSMKTKNMKLFMAVIRHC